MSVAIQLTAWMLLLVLGMVFVLWGENIPTKVFGVIAGLIGILESLVNFGVIK